MNAYNNFYRLLMTLVLAFIGGSIIASIYATLYLGFIESNIAGAILRLETIDNFEFFYHTPFSYSYNPHIWKAGLCIIGFVSFCACSVVFKMTANKVSVHHGSAMWADFKKMATLNYLRPYRKITGPLFGKTTAPNRNGLYLTNGEQPHSIVVAPTRAGKGVGVVIPTLLTFDGSIVALDVKGELFELTSRARKARGDRVFKLSPLDRNGRTHCYNPVLDIVAAPRDRQFLETRRLATNLIVAKGKGSEGFIDGARDLFVAGILYCIEKGNPTIGAVYDLFASPGEKYKLFAQLAEESKIPEVQRIFDNMASNDTKIITSYTSVLGDGGLNLWADELIKRATSKSDFSIYNLRRDPTSIFIVVSPNDLEVVSPLVRLFFQQLVSLLQRDMPEKDETFEVLFLLDEFKHLGKLEAIETAITTIAGYKGRFMFIIQSLAALTGNYEQSGKENFLGNCGLQVFMSTADDETPQYISKAVGEYTYSVKSKSYSIKELFNTNISMSEQGAALLRPEQIRLLDDDTEIVLIKGQPPMKLPKIKYYSDKVIGPIFRAQKGPLPEPLTIEEDVERRAKMTPKQKIPSANPSSGGSKPMLEAVPPVPKPEPQQVAEPVLSATDAQAIAAAELQRKQQKLLIQQELAKRAAAAEAAQKTKPAAMTPQMDAFSSPAPMSLDPSLAALLAATPKQTPPPIAVAQPQIVLTAPPLKAPLNAPLVELTPQQKLLEKIKSAQEKTSRIGQMESGGIE
jgi:type IV secretion system protein VirD4